MAEPEGDVSRGDGVKEERSGQSADAPMSALKPAVNVPRERWLKSKNKLKFTLKGVVSILPINSIGLRSLVLKQNLGTSTCMPSLKVLESIVWPTYNSLDGNKHSQS